MAIWLGEAGGLRIGRANAGPAYGDIEAANVNAAEKRFDFGLAKTSLITGDQVLFTRVDGGNIDFISGVSGSSTTLFVHVDAVGGIRVYDTWDQALAGSAAAAKALNAPGGTYRLSYQVINNDEPCLAQTISWTLNTDRDLADFTSLGDSFKQQMGTLVSGSGDIDCFFDSDWRRSETGYETESPMYLQQLAIRQELGANFVGVFLMQRSGTVSLNDLCTSGDIALFYYAECVVTSVATELLPGEPIHSKITFVTTGPIKLLYDNAGKYLL